MKSHFIFLIIFVCANTLVSGQNTVNDYFNFLNQEHLSPKEYIFRLFETNDIVILGERDHRDTTQYDLILEIIADKRFVNNIGHVYTEVGVTNRTEWANAVLKNQYSNDNEFERELVKLYRELDFNPLWEKYNMYKYLKGIYNINRVLPIEKKITIGLTDIEFDWKGMTYSKYHDFEKTLYKDIGVIRDSIMALNFLKLYDNQKPINGRKKALFIQNQPHAIDVNTSFGKSRVKSTGSYIKDIYSDNVKIVLFNWYNFGAAFYFMPHTEVGLTDDGKWDAAFELSKHKPVGFDLSNTPFGNMKYYDNYEQNIKYKDVADGVIFYKPFYDFVAAIGMPKVVDSSFTEELLNRYIISFGEENSNSKKFIKSPEIHKKKWMNYHNTLRTFNCADYRKMKKQMNKWIK